MSTNVCCSQEDALQFEVNVFVGSFEFILKLLYSVAQVLLTIEVQEAALYCENSQRVFMPCRYYCNYEMTIDVHKRN